MNNTITYVIVAVVIVYFLYARVLPLFRSVSKELGSLKLNPNANAALPADQYRKVALGAIYSEQQSAYLNSLTTGLDATEIREKLSSWWGIDSKAEAIETLQRLLREGHRSYASAVFAALRSPNPEATIRQAFSDSEEAERAVEQLENLRATLPELKELKVITAESQLSTYGAAGWDFGRVVFVARLCLDAGYLTAPEAGELIEAADQLARRAFRNWADFGKSYCIGRAMWGGAETGNGGIIAINDYLLTDPKSPWVQLPW